MDIRILAAFLVVGHLTSATFILMVLIRQSLLFRIKVQRGLVWFRRILFLLALGIFFGNFIPVLIDSLTIFSLVTRSTSHVNPIGIAYSVSNAVVFALSALLVWIMYRMAATTVLIVEHDKEAERDKIKTKEN